MDEREMNDRVIAFRDLINNLLGAATSSQRIDARRELVGEYQQVLKELCEGRRTTPDREAWQPIETAPKDGTPLVMFARYIHATASIVVVAAWLETYGMWVNQSFSGGPIQQIVPSHWMPRPEFPTSDKGD